MGRVLALFIVYVYVVWGTRILLLYLVGAGWNGLDRGSQMVLAGLAIYITESPASQSGMRSSRSLTESLRSLPSAARRSWSSGW